MNRQELVKAVADETGNSQAEVGKILSSLIDTIQKNVAAGEKIALVGFGTFATSSRAARTGKNPKTGAPIAIPASTSPRFIPGKTFKDLVKAG